MAYREGTPRSESALWIFEFRRAARFISFPGAPHRIPLFKPATSSSKNTAACSFTGKTFVAVKRPAEFEVGRKQPALVLFLFRPPRLALLFLAISRSAFVRNNSDMKYVPRVARVFVVSMPLFSTLPSEKAARDEEEKRNPNESTERHSRDVERGLRSRLVDQSLSLSIARSFLPNQMRVYDSLMLIANKIDTLTSEFTLYYSRQSNSLGRSRR